MELEYTRFPKPIYYADHDKRYAHIHPMDRHLYPDELVLNDYGRRIKRTKPFKELLLEDVPDGLDACLIANDVPYPEGCIKV